jgi:hypothetical protein
MDNIYNYYLKKSKVYLEASSDDKIFSPDYEDDLYAFIKIDDNTAKLLGSSSGYEDKFSSIKEESFGNFKRKNDILSLKKTFENVFNKKKSWVVNDLILKNEKIADNIENFFLNKTQTKTFNKIQEFIDSLEKKMDKDGKIKILPEKTRKDFLKVIDIINEIKANYNLHYESDSLIDLLKRMEIGEKNGEKSIFLYPEKSWDFKEPKMPEEIRNLSLKYDKDDPRIRSIVFDKEGDKNKIFKIIENNYVNKMKKENANLVKEIEDYLKKSEFKRLDGKNRLEYVFNPDTKLIETYETENKEKIKKLNEFKINNITTLNDYIKNGELFLGYLRDKEAIPISTSTESTIDFEIRVPFYYKKGMQLYAYSSDYGSSNKDDDNKKKGFKIKLSDKNIKDLKLEEDFRGVAIFSCEVFTEDLDEFKLEIKFVGKKVPLQQRKSIFRIFIDVINNENTFLGVPFIINAETPYIKKDEVYVINTKDSKVEEIIKNMVPGDYVSGEIIDNKIEISDATFKKPLKYNVRYINNKLFAYINDSHKKLILVSKLINPKIYDKLVSKIKPTEEILQIEEKKFQDNFSPQKEKLLNDIKKIDIELSKLNKDYKKLEEIKQSTGKSKMYQFVQLNKQSLSLIRRKDSLLKAYSKTNTPLEQNLVDIEECSKYIDELNQENNMLNDRIDYLDDLKYKLEIFDEEENERIELTPEQLERINDIKNKNKQKRIIKLEKIVSDKISNIGIKIKKNEDEMDKLLTAIYSIQDDLREYSSFSSTVSIQNKNYIKDARGNMTEYVNSKDITKSVQQILDDRERMVDFIVKNPMYQNKVLQLKGYINKKLRSKINQSEIEYVKRENDFEKQIASELRNIRYDIENNVIYKLVPTSNKIELYIKNQKKEDELKKELLKKFEDDIEREMKKITTFESMNMSDERNLKMFKELRVSVNSFNDDYNFFIEFIQNLRENFGKSVGKEKIFLARLITLLDQLNTTTIELLPFEIENERLRKEKATLSEFLKNKNYVELKKIVEEELAKDPGNFKKIFFTKKSGPQINKLIADYKKQINDNNIKIKTLEEESVRLKEKTKRNDNYYSLKNRLNSVTFLGRQGVLFDDDGDVQEADIVYILDED